MNGCPPLDGIRVVEHTHALAGRTAGALLADLGAEVIQVPVAGRSVSPEDPARVWSDRRKVLRSVGSGPGEERAEVRRLLPLADVFVSDLPPARLESMMLDAISLRVSQPRLVHVWMPPYGTEGRESYLAADPLILAALSGYADTHPSGADRPVAPVVPTFSYVHGVIASAAATAALVGRERSGGGNAVRVSGLDAMGAVLGSLMISHDSGRSFLSVGRDIKGAPYFRLYQGSDGSWFYLAALSPAIFARALVAVDRIELMVRDDVAGEFANLLEPGVRQSVNAALEETFASLPTDEWLRILRDAEVPVAPVWSRDRWKAEGVGPAARLCHFDHPLLGPLTVPGPSIDLPATPLLADSSAPPSWGTNKGDWRLASVESSAPDAQAAPLPLDGLRIVDMSSFYADPFGGALLADFGAHVVKVEPTDGDPYRVFAVSYAMVNQRKSVAALDLTDETARAAFLQMLARSDAMLDNLLPQSWERLGLGESTILEANPDLVRCSISAFGEGNDWSAAPGFDPVLQAMTGLAIAQGGPRAPAPSSAPVVDAVTGALAAVGTLAGLFAKARWGVAQHVRTSLASGAVLVQSGEMTSYRGRPTAPEGSADFLGPDPGRRLYRTADHWLAIATSSDSQRRDMLDALGHADWSALDDAALGSAFEKQLATAPSALWLELLAAAGVAAARVLDHNTGIADRYLAVNEFSHLLEVPGHGTCRVVRNFSHWEGGPARTARAPAPGADTVDVLLEAGVEGHVVQELLSRGIAGSPGA